MLLQNLERAKCICNRFTIQEPEILIRGNYPSKLAIIFQDVIPTEEERSQIAAALSESFNDVVSNSMPEANFISWIVTSL